VKTSAQTDIEPVLKALKEFGLLLETDAKLPSVSGLVAREPLCGSWWAHPRSHEIFAVLQELVDHQDVMITKLVSEKVTFVNRKLWPYLLSIATARETWQMRGLSPAARILLKMIDQGEQVRSDRIEWPAKIKSVKPGPAVRELEKKLLIHSEEFHTDSGAHAKLMESWEHWAQRIRFKRHVVEVAVAKQRLEEKLRELNDRFGAGGRLPWIRTR
jgi:hypothetical protein